MVIRRTLAMVVLLLVAVARIVAADIAGAWTADFESDIGSSSTDTCSW